MGGIRSLGAALADGLRVSFRREKQAARVLQGLEGRRRPNNDGVIIIDIAMGGEHSEISKQVDLRNAMFLSKTGDDRASLGDFRPYQSPHTPHPPR